MDSDSRERRALEEIRAYLQEGLGEVPLSGTSDSLTQKHDEETHSNTNQKGAGEQIVIDATQSEDVPSSTEQYTTVLNRFSEHLQIVNSVLRTSASVLDCLAIPIQEEENLTISLPKEIHANVQGSLHQLTSLFQQGMMMAQRFQQMCIIDSTNHGQTDQIGEELDERADRITSVPSDDAGEHRLTESIQEESRPMNSTIPKENHALLDLRQLLLPTRKMRSVALKIIQQPQKFWKKRNLNCLRNRWSPALQGRSNKQKDYIQIEWTKLTNENLKDLLILIQLLATDDKPHRSNLLLPPKTTVQNKELPGKRKRNEKARPAMNDLIIKDGYGWDPETKTILYTVSTEEYNQCKMSLPVIMLRLYDTSEDILPSTAPENSTDDDEEEEVNPSADKQLLKLSKLRLYLCQRTKTGELISVSNSVVTELIEESKGAEQLEIDPSQITPRKLCSCGNETINVPLNTDSEKAGFHISLNGEELPFRQFSGVVKKTISFKSRPKTEPDQQSLHVTVAKESISETIKRHLDPHRGLVKIPLLDLQMIYIERSDNPHEHQGTTT